MFAPRGWLQGRGNRAMYRTISGSGEFDASWYRSHLSFPSSLFDPIWHYLRRGWLEGLNPSPRFDTGFYLRWNKDVREAGVNPFDHYLRYGKEEGRPPQKPLGQWYPKSLTDVQPIRLVRNTVFRQKRITVVFDDQSPQRWSGDYAFPTVLMAHAAHATGRSIRVLLRGQVPPVDPQIRKNTRWPRGVPFPEEIRVPGNDDYVEIDKHDEEIFVATSWSSLVALSRSTPSSHLVYFKFDNEIANLGAGAAHEIAVQADNSIEAVRYYWPTNRELKRTVRTRRSADAKAMQIPTELVAEMLPLEADTLIEWDVLVWAGSDANYSHTRSALHVIEELIVERELPNLAPRIVVAGARVPGLILGGAHHVAVVSKPPLRAELSLIKSSQVVVALTASGVIHPVAALARDNEIAVVTSIDPDVMKRELKRALSRRKGAPAKLMNSKPDNLVEFLEAFRKRFA